MEQLNGMKKIPQSNFGWIHPSLLVHKAFKHKD